ncbi:MAG: response regulator [Bacteroidetes bacterium]|nr:MAG: response regulator [Bacteroidota bacterium]MBL1144089.1 response regulator [Bacteroidota bacterium]MCB0801503.1 LytTR family transcriptional regulator DNA-binding domain-containing protein [Flavobacteriales bacterium]NOG56885.1 response regulator [Bacteroidota bacterium]
MKALVIDDERLARKELMNLLEAHPEIEVIGECNNADNAIKKIEVLKPDLIFLDIQMPGKDGFGLLEEISFVPHVIFTTAYDEYAIKAFEVNAFDYLLKPIEQERLATTIDKLKQLRTEEEAQIEQLEKQDSFGRLGEMDQVFVKDGEKCWFVKLKDVSLFESEGNYVRIYFKDYKPLILKSLNSLEQRLDSKVFFRANRKFIINLNWVNKIENWFNGGLRVNLNDGKQVEISRRQAAKLKDMMSL